MTFMVSKFQECRLANAQTKTNTILNGKTVRIKSFLKYNNVVKSDIQSCLL